ncbi:hypothetical protein M413DRAFT_79050 [Hebeloma cylindrosporum]|uniref:Uncharacterized protein n=1 Tax=Hebeloma cylindrosporum TaxID=76867 RepID=A0A0C3BWM7_HEBCY|nr:hypothetical protein M413DRAFT_79050 [Hebeloma cylindrosporum h7]
MHPFNAIFGCLCPGHAIQYDILEEQPARSFSHEKKHDPRTTQSLAEEILSTLYATTANDEKLAQRVDEIVSATGWYEGLAAAVLNGLETAIKAEAPMGQGMRDAYDKAAEVIAQVFQFAKDHPVFVAFVALGILVILAPWAIEALGFGELGPIEGTFAAWWQSAYGNVPAGALFTFFQRLGMVWRL